MGIFKALQIAFPLSILLWAVLIVVFSTFVSAVSFTNQNFTSVGGGWVYVNNTMNATAVGIDPTCINFTNLIFNQSLYFQDLTLNATLNNTEVNFTFCDGNGYLFTSFSVTPPWTITTDPNIQSICSLGYIAQILCGILIIIVIAGGIITIMRNLDTGAGSIITTILTVIAMTVTLIIGIVITASICSS